MPSNLRSNAVRRARELATARPLILDTETTGLNPLDEIIEISLVDLDGKKLFETLIQPTRPIPADATRIHQITDDMVKNAPVWKNVWPQIEPLISSRYIGVYNADFDRRMLRQTHQVHGITWNEASARFFCIMKLYADFYPFGRGKYQKLEDAGRQCGIKLPNSHRAFDDALLALEIFRYIANTT